MIFDVHAHLMGPEVPGRAFWDGFTRLAAVQSGRTEDRIRERLQDIYDLTGDRLIQDMDGAGVDWVMIMPIDWGLVRPFQGEGTMGIWEQHVLHAQVGPETPRPCCHFRLFRPQASQRGGLAAPGRGQFGGCGPQDSPGGRVFPSDRVVYPMYEKAQELGLPVMVHTGPEPKPLYSRHCQPVYVDDVAVDFPDLTIILAHAGMGAWWQEAAGIAAVCPNVYLEFSGWQPMARLRPWSFIQPCGR